MRAFAMKLAALIYILCFAMIGLEATEPVLICPLMNNGTYWPVSTRFLVIVHQYDGDVRWASRLKFPHIIYEKNKPEKEPFNAINKAKAETNLLKFIAEFYDDLPENVIQVYQYEHKWHHNGSLVDILNAPDFEMKYAGSKTRGFWNFNNCNLGDLSAQIPRMLESGWWPMGMAPWFGDIRDYGDFTQGKRACAQFVVSRERIKTLPREFYSNMYLWLVTNTIGEVDTGFNPRTKTRNPTPLDNHSNGNFFTSRYMEWSWELIFTSHKPHEYIEVPFLFTESNSQQQSAGLISALYGAKKYYRDVTTEVIKHFLCNESIVIPADANFNNLFTDVMYNSVKTLILNVNGKEYKIPERRSRDTVIKLSSNTK
jgi:Protein of unknown function (DUF3431)